MGEVLTGIDPKDSIQDDSGRNKFDTLALVLNTMLALFVLACLILGMKACNYVRSIETRIQTLEQKK